MNWDLTKPSHIMMLLEKHGFRFSKSLGQNFIIQRAIIDQIVDGSEIDSDTLVIEIGPGFGVLTQPLCQRAGKVVSIEIDRALYPVLEETMAGYSTFSLIQEDVLSVDFDSLIQTMIDENGKPFTSIKVVANLPYYITTPILFKLLEQVNLVDEIIVMVQKEVANRLVASPDSGKSYGSLSVVVGYYSEITFITTVPKHCFMPSPKVDSAVIKLKKRPFSVVVTSEPFFLKVVKASFAQRRKTLVNSLSSVLSIEKTVIEEALTEMSLNVKIRGERLTGIDFAMLSNILYNKIGNMQK